MHNNKKIKNQKGFAAIFATILVLGSIFIITISLNTLTLGQQKISSNALVASKAYYAAEAGLEDALLRLKKNPAITSLSYSFNIGGETVSVSIPETIGGSRTITSDGNVSNRARKVQAVYAIDASEAAFYYGVQVDEGGVIMGNNARIVGNVFSNGSVISSGRGYVNNNIVVAGNENYISGLKVGGDALVYKCQNSKIGGDLTYVAGGSTNCTVSGSTIQQPDEIPPGTLPISPAQIQEWKGQAALGGVIPDNVSFSGNGGSSSLGPVQIGTQEQPRNLTISNNFRLKVAGTIYVTGDVSFENNSIIELDPSYGSFSGMIIASGKINVSNNAILRGSGQAGSYILILSTNNSLNPSSPAINVGNNAQGAIFYTTSGLIYLNNNMVAREVTGYKIRINNNAQVLYEVGLEHVVFTSGPGGSFRVEDWREIE